MIALRCQVFRGWPAKPPPLDVRPAADVRHDGLRLRAYDFVSEENVDAAPVAAHGRESAKSRRWSS